MKPSDPVLLADDTLCCRMYPSGKVAISQQLATPGFTRCTVLQITKRHLLKKDQYLA